MPDTEKQRILVVDDDPTISDVVTRYLQSDGYDVQVAFDGEEALEHARAFTPISWCWT